jgi:hypothetical protein
MSNRTVNTDGLVGLETVETIIETIIMTAYVKAPNTCSIILVGPSGSGKSQSMLRYRKFPSVYIANDLTTMAMAEILANDKKGQIRHFLLPDLNPSLSHKNSVTSLWLSSLLTLQSEGVFTTGEGTRVQKIHHTPVGIITACTPEMYEIHHKKLRILGMIRRNAPIFYTLSEDTIRKAHLEKINGKIHAAVEARLPELARTITDVTIGIREAELIMRDADLFAEYLSIGPVWHSDPSGKRWSSPGKVENMLPLAPHDYLRTLAKAHALRQGRTVVNSMDVDFVRTFVSFTKYGKESQL